MILNENELNEIKGLLHYLNSAMNGSVQPDKIDDTIKFLVRG